MKFWLLISWGMLLGVLQAQQEIPENQRSLPGPKSSANLFTEYRKAGFSKWKQHWTYRYDLTGVAMDSWMVSTLITRRHVVMAKHYPRKVGDRLHFHDRKGKAVARTLIKIADTKFDVAVGLLDKPVPKGIMVYPLPRIKGQAEDELTGMRLLITNKSRQLYVAEVDRVIGKNYLKMRHAEGFKPKKLIGGDSGNPGFFLFQGGLVLAETHTHGGAGGGPFYGSTEVQEEIRAAMKKLGVILPLELIAVE